MASVSKEKLYLIYPETDGKPMAENTLQFEWIVLIKLGLEAYFMDRDDVFIAGDLFWYPVEGDPKTRLAPDVLVALGRPKGHRGSYLQWMEGGIAPQVIFEVLSPGNRKAEMERKYAFYEKYGAKEYYIYNPDKNKLTGYLRKGNSFQPIEEMYGWTSPLLNIHFNWNPERLQLLRPDGNPFLSYADLVEMQQERIKDMEHQRELLHKEQKRAKRAELRAESAEKNAHVANDRAQKYADKLRELGIDPDKL